MGTIHVWRKLSLVALFCIAQVIFFLSPIFKINQIRVDGNKFLNSEELIQSSPFRTGMYYWALLFSCRNFIDDPAIVSSGVRLEPHGVLVIKVVERVPVVLVYSEQSNVRWLLVDREGRILAEERPKDGEYPRLKVDFDVPLRGCMDSALIGVVLKAAPQVEKALKIKPLYYDVDSMQSITVHLNFIGSEAMIKLGTLENLSVKLDIVRTLMEKLEAKKQKVELIDVRYPQAVIKPAAKNSPKTGTVTLPSFGEPKKAEPAKEEQTTEEQSAEDESTLAVP
ncbi:MAG: cell division protein FtsQ/DivIB [bacterium]|nr:cell division protein FtsQ/DivIB [bacterium]